MVGREAEHPLDPGRVGKKGHVLVIPIEHGRRMQ
jgi:hypothetical protein